MPSQYLRMLDEILNKGTEIPDGIRKILEDLHSRLDEHPHMLLSERQSALIKKSYAINIEGKDIRDAHKEFSLPDKYENCSMKHTEDGYFIFVQGVRIGKSISKTEGQMILAWLTRALSALEVLFVDKAPKKPKPATKEDDDLSYMGDEDYVEEDAGSSRPF